MVLEGAESGSRIKLVGLFVPAQLADGKDSFPKQTVGLLDLTWMRQPSFSLAMQLLEGQTKEYPKQNVQMNVQLEVYHLEEGRPFIAIEQFGNFFNVRVACLHSKLQEILAKMELLSSRMKGMAGSSQYPQFRDKPLPQGETQLSWARFFVGQTNRPTRDAITDAFKGGLKNLHRQSFVPVSVTCQLTLYNGTDLAGLKPIKMMEILIG
jgi:hypothetical protein